MSKKAKQYSQQKKQKLF